MPRLLKKFVLSFLSALVVLFSFAPLLSVKAQAPASPAPTAPPEGTWYNQSFGQWYNKVYDENTSPSNEIFGERYTAAQVQWVVYGLMSFILNATLGSSNQQIVTCMLTNTTDINSCMDLLKGMLGSTAQPSVAQKPQPQESLLSLIFADRPLSGVTYVKEKLHNFSLVPVAHAQTAGAGFGFDALAPVQEMWRGVRDISFALFVIAAIVLSFMIMFRLKISPQVVVSIQSAIPKLIIALILVTFSYAIAGFLVDLMYVVIGLLSLMMKPLIGTSIPTAAIFRVLTTGQPTTANVNIGFLGLGIVYLMLFSLIFLVLLIANLGIVASALTVGAIGFLTGVAPILIVIFILIAVIVVLMVIWYFVKVFWSLLKAFAMVIILTIIAPLEIVLGVVLPNMGFGTWVKSYISNLGVFVVTGALVLLSFVFLFTGANIGISATGANFNTLSQFVFGGAITSAFNSNAGSASWPPLLGGGNNNYMVGLLFVGVSFVVFTLIPKANEVAQGLMSGKPVAYGSGIGEAMGGPASFVAGAAMGGLNKSAATFLSDQFDKRFPRKPQSQTPTAQALKNTGGPLPSH